MDRRNGGGHRWDSGGQGHVLRGFCEIPPGFHSNTALRSAGGFGFFRERPCRDGGGVYVSLLGNVVSSGWENRDRFIILHIFGSCLISLTGIAQGSGCLERYGCLPGSGGRGPVLQKIFLKEEVDGVIATEPIVLEN